LIETGAVGFAIMLWFLLTAYYRAARKLENWTRNPNGAVALAAMLGITGIMFHSLVDFNLQIPANAALFYALCVMAAMEPRFGSLSRGRRHRLRDAFEDKLSA
jgi:O-antigen ligase